MVSEADIRSQVVQVLEAALVHLRTLQGFGIRFSPRTPARSKQRSKTRLSEFDTQETGMPRRQPNLFVPADTAAIPASGLKNPDRVVWQPNRLSVSEAEAKLKDIHREIGECTRCRLHEQRTHIVFGEGDPRASLMFVGEGPGADEDRTGRPFVGRAGQLLDRIIEAMGLKREEVFIGNVVKCRPPENRTPQDDEMRTCGQFLVKQIEVIAPRHIICLGATAAKYLLNTQLAMNKIRGRFFDGPSGSRILATFHPAYLLRNPAAKKDVWEDVQKVIAERNKPVEG